MPQLRSLRSPLRIMGRLAILATIMLALLIVSAPTAHANTLTVDVDGDGLTIGGGCTLREALFNANFDLNTYPECGAGSGVDEIRFAIGSPGSAQTITMGAGGFLILNTVTINGFSQGGVGYAGPPLIEINAAGAGGGISAFTITGLTASNSSISGLTVNRAGGYGVLVTAANNVSLFGNYIGTDTTGNAAQGNGLGGVWLDSDGVTIGGPGAGQGNVISGNGSAGVAPGITLSTASGTTIFGNSIGVGADGATAVSNGGPGILVSDSPNTTIGGAAAGEGNVISSNGNGVASPGINAVGTNLDQLIIRGNRIGVAADGVTARPNSGSGVLISGAGSAAGVEIGGDTSGARNVIAANGQHGIQVIARTAGSVSIRGNRIGTDESGTLDRGNGLDGIFLGNAPNVAFTVGGSGSTEGNIVSSNNGHGVRLSPNLNEVVIRGNRIGTDVTGSTALGNSRNGIFVEGGGGTIADTSIGGTGSGAGNVIAFNGERGISITGNGALGNAINGNSIFSNGDLGIDLGEDGVTANDDGDSDVGPNTRQNFPVLSRVAVVGSNVHVDGVLDSTAATTYRVELFANDACDGTNGEGRTLLGSSNVTIGTGPTTFAVTGLAAVPPGSVVTATATDPDGNTSEFSACATPISPSVIVSTPTVTVAEGGATTTFTVRLNNVPLQPVTITLTSDASELTVSPTTLTFAADASALNEQVVTIGAIADQVAEGTHTSTIELAATSSDPVFNGIAVADVVATITDDSVPTIIVTPTSGLITTEAGGAATFSVRLATIPTGAVTIALSSSNPAEGTVAPATLTFQADASALQPQTVTVTGVDDSLSDGDVAYAIITAPASSTDSAYNGLNPPDVDVVNQDDDTSGTIRVSAATLDVTEGTPATITVTRSGGGASGVTVQFATTDGTAQAGQDYTTTSGMLTFDTGETSKTVTVPILADDTDEPAETFTLALSNPTGGAVLGSPSAVTVTIADRDTTPCQTTLSAAVPVGSTVLPVVSQAGCAVGDTIAVNPGGANEERFIVTGFGSIIVNRPSQNAHAAGEPVVRVTPAPVPPPAPDPVPEPIPSPSPVPVPVDDDDKPRKETEEERHQRQRTNRSGQDDYRNEGNVVGVACDTSPPTVTIGNRDGDVEVRLLGDAAERCGDIRVGDYVEVEGEKIHEQLFEATDVSITRRR